jgi:hypothetical protein
MSSNDDDNGGVALAASAATWGQTTGASFTATGQSCDQVTWSAESLAKYPKIASACQSVLRRMARA